MTVLRIPALYMRGGTSKGVFFRAHDLPADPALRDRVLLRVIGSPDRFGKHIDGMGGATSSTSKVVLLSASSVVVEFIDPAGDDDGADAGGAMFPTGSRIETVHVPGFGSFEATLITAGLPTIYVDAVTLGLAGTELQRDVNGDRALLDRVETIRAHASVRFGLTTTAAESTATRPHTPKVAFVAAPATYVASDGRTVAANSIDLLARVFSMGQLHHAMTGTGAISLAVACAIPGNLVSRIAGTDADGRVRIGHPSGHLVVGAEAVEHDGKWTVTKAIMSRSARRLMDGVVSVPMGG